MQLEIGRPGDRRRRGQEDETGYERGLEHLDKQQTVEDQCTQPHEGHDADPEAQPAEAG